MFANLAFVVFGALRVNVNLQTTPKNAVGLIETSVNLRNRSALAPICWMPVVSRIKPRGAQRE